MLETVVLARAAKDLTIPVAAGVGAVGVGVASYALYQWLKDGPFSTLGDVWTAIKNPIDTTKGWWAKGDAEGGWQDRFASWLGMSRREPRDE